MWMDVSVVQRRQGLWKGGSRNSYGHHEDNHSNNMPYVISAGYKTEVKQFMGTNAELRRRINHHFSPRLFATTVCGFIE